MAKTHMLTGWCSGVGVAACAGYWSTSHLAPVIGFGLLGAGVVLLNDIDHESSKVTKTLGPLGWLLCRIIRGMSGTVYRLTATEKDRSSDGKHRCLTHTGIWAITLGMVTWWACWRWAPGYEWLGLAMFVGCLTHDCGDAMTESGVPLLWPIKIKGQRWYRVGMPKILRFKTGNKKTGTERRFIRPGFALLSVLVFPGVVSTLILLVQDYLHPQ